MMMTYHSLGPWQHEPRLQDLAFLLKDNALIMIWLFKVIYIQVLMHSLGHWRLEPGLHDLAFLPNIVQPASRLLVQGQQVGMIAVIIITITIIINIIIIIIIIMIHLPPACRLLVQGQQVMAKVMMTMVTIILVITTLVTLITTMMTWGCQG